MLGPRAERDGGLINPKSRAHSRCSIGAPPSIFSFSFKVFSSEVDAGSREENTIKQGILEPFRFNRNWKDASL
jgi:hypothetical protein